MDNGKLHLACERMMASAALGMTEPSLAELASAVRLSPTQFGRAFAQTTDGQGVCKRAVFRFIGGNRMTRILFVGQTPDTVDYSDPALPPGFNAEKIQAGIDLAAAKITERGWIGDICMIPPDASGIATLEKQLASAAYGCVVVGGGMRLPPKSLVLFEQVVNAIHRKAPGAAIAFNTHPEDTADAAARWLKTDGSPLPERA